MESIEDGVKGWIPVDLAGGVVTKFWSTMSVDLFLGDVSAPPGDVSAARKFSANPWNSFPFFFFLAGPCLLIFKYQEKSKEKKSKMMTKQLWQRRIY